MASHIGVVNVSCAQGQSEVSKSVKLDTNTCGKFRKTSVQLNLVPLTTGQLPEVISVVTVLNVKKRKRHGS